MTVGVAVACNTYTSELLLDDDSGVDSSDTTDSTATGGSGGSSNDVTTALTSGTSTSTNASTSSGGGSGGGSGGSGTGGSGGAGATGSASETTSAGGSGGSDVTANSTTEATTTTTTDGGGGGTGGTGGSSTTAPPDVLLIDDLEDGDNRIERPYTGYWFTTVDVTGSGTVTPDPDDRCDPEILDTPRDDSTRAMHVSGTWTGSDVWIAATGFPLDNDESAVDASSYTGVSFYARTENENTEVRLQVMITDVEDEAHFEIVLPITSSWELFEVEWDDPYLVQPDWTENEVPFNPAELWKLQFQFDSEAFDLWVDDIRFMEGP